MAKKQLYRLTEADVKNIMSAVLKRVLTEGTTNTEEQSTWNYYKTNLGADKMLDMIWEYLDANQIRDIIECLRRDLDDNGGYME